MNKIRFLFHRLFDYPSEGTERVSISLVLKGWFIYLFVLMGQRILFFMENFNREEMKWLWPVGWLSFISPPWDYLLLWSLILLFCLLCLHCFLHPFSLFGKGLAVTLFFFLISAYFSRGYIHHSLHSCLFASLFLVFINDKNKRETNRQCFLWAQNTALTPYFLSGLWKLRENWEYFLSAEGWEVLSEGISRLRAKSFLDKYPAGNAPAEDIFLNLSGGLGLFLWCCNLFFQLGTFGVFFFPGLKRLWGLLLVCFHLMTLLLLHIPFSPVLYLAILLLIIPTNRNLSLNT